MSLICPSSLPNPLRCRNHIKKRLWVLQSSRESLNKKKMQYPKLTWVFSKLAEIPSQLTLKKLQWEEQLHKPNSSKLKEKKRCHGIQSMAVDLSTMENTVQMTERWLSIQNMLLLKKLSRDLKMSTISILWWSQASKILSSSSWAPSSKYLTKFLLMKCHRRLFKITLLGSMRLKPNRLKDIMNSADLRSSESIAMLFSSNLKKRRF